MLWYLLIRSPHRKESKMSEAKWNVAKFEQEVAGLTGKVPELTCVLWINKEQSGMQIKGTNFEQYHEVDNWEAFKGNPNVQYRFGTYFKVEGNLHTYEELAKMFSLPVLTLKRLANEEKIITPVVAGSKGIPAKFDQRAVDAIFAHFTK